MNQDADQYVQLPDQDDTVINAFEQAAFYHDSNWMDEASCATLESTDFFPASDTVYFPTLDVAKTCLACPVRKQCIETIGIFETTRTSADSVQKGKGFFAGLTPKLRKEVYQHEMSNWYEVATTKLNAYIIFKEGTARNQLARQAKRKKKGIL